MMTEKLSPKAQRNIRKWIDALRSGKYRQGKGALRRIEAYGESTFCCLGVACDVFKGKKGRWADEDVGAGQRVRFIYEDEEDRTDLPTALVRETEISPVLFKYWQGDGFIYLNDGLDATFDEIADLLDIYLLENS